jgi:two-component system chemotaxis response regulator CheB
VNRPAPLTGPPRIGPAARGRTIRVMIVDDSLVARTVLSRIVEAASDCEIVAKATTGEMAIARLAETPADVILLDLEMPGMGGIGALPKILALADGGQVLVVSSLTAKGAEHTLAALSMGAADTLLKPRVGEFDADYGRALIAKIRALAARSGGGDSRLTRPPVPQLRAPLQRERPLSLAIGASTGGIHALCLLLGALPRSFELPILVVQHLPESFMETLARQLAAASGRGAVVANAGTVCEPGRIYVAPGHGHMTVRREGQRLITGIAHHAAPSGCTPSVDPLFESLADAVGGGAIGVVLSGMGRDGAIGAARLVKAGGTLFAQDEASSAVWGMPRAVAEAGLASAVLPPDQIAARVAALAAQTEAIRA